MGLFQSTPPTPPPPPPSPSPKLTVKPWRKIKGWDESVREELREEVASLKPVTHDQSKCEFINILLMGQIKAGKSSVFNSINSVFANKVISSDADAGNVAKSLTREICVYEVKPDPSPDAAPLPWRIIDTMGLDTETGEVDMKNLLKAVDGHVPNNYKFTPGLEFNDKFKGYVDNPTLAVEAHCVAVVIDASQMKHMEEEMWNLLWSLRKGLIARKKPTYIILTHIDEACPKVKEDIKHVYHSISIQDRVSTIGRRLLGLPENQIFPVKNYVKDVELDNDMDILLLYALRQMLYSAQAHIRKRM